MSGFDRNQPEVAAICDLNGDLIPAAAIQEDRRRCGAYVAGLTKVLQLRREALLNVHRCSGGPK